MFSSYYSFIKEEDNDVEYTFYSAINDIIYIVTFSIDDYSPYIDSFPTLLQNSYSFGFRSKKFSQKNTLKDDLIFPTIYQTMIDFINSKGIETVLLYHCDTADYRQSYRNKLFNNWEKLIHNSHLYKHSMEAEIQMPNRNSVVKYYFGFIAFKNNPQIEKIKQEFDSFTYYIIQPKQD